METCEEKVSIDLRRVLLSIAQALDDVGFDALNHSHRVGYMAYRCALRMGWDQEQAQLSFAAGLIHDCGSTQHSASMPFAASRRPGSFARHCEKGFNLLGACGPLSRFSLPVLYHHTPWHELQTLAIEERDKQIAALIYLTNRVDHLYFHQHKDQFGNLSASAKRQIIEQLQAHSGTLFAAHMVDHMAVLVENDDFWFSMHPQHIEAVLLRLDAAPLFSSNLNLDERIEIAELFSKIVDAKSPFTFQHSLKVALLSQYLAKKMGYSAKMQKLLYLAGLLHDIGKLRTPDFVLHKEGTLTAEEYTCIKRHATDTRFILQDIHTSSLVCDWASNHHERLDGSGYPLGKTAQELDGPSRIVAVADVFQALTQSRPYRQGMSLEQSLSIIAEQVANNQLDGDVFACLQHNAQHCYWLSADENEVGLQSAAG
ncbi:HD domain-containing phosphohydrolase [Vibrio sp. CDRSL-10 TSBA]